MVVGVIFSPLKIFEESGREIDGIKENDCIDKENKTPFSVSEDLHDNAYDETYPR